MALRGLLADWEPMCWILWGRARTSLFLGRSILHHIFRHRSCHQLLIVFGFIFGCISNQLKQIWCHFYEHGSLIDLFMVLAGLPQSQYVSYSKQSIYNRCLLKSPFLTFHRLCTNLGGLILVPFPMHYITTLLLFAVLIFT